LMKHKIQTEYNLNLWNSWVDHELTSHLYEMISRVYTDEDEH
jgi:hypothetical protein